jgi:hypothetical protein
MNARRGPRKSSRQSNPGSLERLQRGIKTTLVGCNDPLEIKCIDMRDGRREAMRVNVAQAVVATMLSWRPLQSGVSQSAIARELLNEGCVLGNSKGVFVNPVSYRARRVS